jgi:nucleotidyltransferase/DNA polymerase involved in DNA repair
MAIKRTKRTVGVLSIRPVQEIMANGKRKNQKEEVLGIRKIEDALANPRKSLGKKFGG